MNTPDIWAVAVYKLSDENGRLRETYGRTAKDCAAMRNDFIRYTGRPDGSHRPYRPSEVTVLGYVEFPAAMLEMVSAITDLVPVAALLHVLSTTINLVTEYGGPDANANADLANNKGWQRLVRDLAA